ncbi:hypothetical protein, partial [Enterococcus casseliflavus]|uniref:hypothetical protein n=1 Tax=Enterococcus casseliflavus TaxID=37734 RepID=UPI00325BC1D8
MEQLKEVLSVKRENLNEVFFEELHVNSLNHIAVINALKDLAQKINDSRDTITVTFLDKSRDESDFIEFQNEFPTTRVKLESMIDEFLDRAELIEEDYFLCSIYISKKEEKNQNFITRSIYDLEKFSLF